MRAPSSRSTRTLKRRSSRWPTSGWSAICSRSCRNSSAWSAAEPGGPMTPGHLCPGGLCRGAVYRRGCCIDCLHQRIGVLAAERHRWAQLENAGLGTLVADEDAGLRGQRIHDALVAQLRGRAVALQDFEAEQQAGAAHAAPAPVPGGDGLELLAQVPPHARGVRRQFLSIEHLENGKARGGGDGTTA